MESNFFINLTKSWDESEIQEIEFLIRQIEQSRAESDDLSVEEWRIGLNDLSVFRLLSSGTLKRGERQGWVAANKYVSQKLLVGASPSSEDINIINAMMRDQETVSIRNVDVYLGFQKTCSPQELPAFLEYFYQNILPIEKHSHPLIAAALVRFWLVSLHPFEDANGRTSVMIADWLLLKSSYLPLSFERQLDAIIATFESSRKFATPGQAVIKSLRSVLHSYKVLLRRKK